MRICIDASPAVHQRAGIGRYTQELTAALLSIDPENEYLSFLNDAQGIHLQAPFDHLPALTVRRPDKLWRLSVLLAALTGSSQGHLFPDTDLFHATDYILPELPNKKRVFTLYDLTYRLFPQTHTALNRWYLTLMVPQFLKKSQAVFLISENTKRDAIKLYGVEEEKCVVTHLGVNPIFHPSTPKEKQSLREKYNLPAQFILSVGTLEPRKNLPLLLDAVHSLQQRGLSMPVVLVGKKGWQEEVFFQKLRSLGLEEQVIRLGFVPEEELPALYSSAVLFVYPSLYEGFGLPVLEALACGAPTICSNSSSLPEVAGEAAILIDPHDAAGLAGAMERVITDAGLQAELRRRGIARASGFTWEKTARKTLAVYEKLPGRVA